MVTFLSFVVPLAIGYAACWFSKDKISAWIAAVRAKI